MNAYASLQQHWYKLASRERLAIGWAVALVLAFLVWRLLLAPALQVLREAPTQAAALDVQIQSMLAMQAAAESLQNRPKLSHAEAEHALDAAVRQNLPGVGQLSIQGDTATLQLKAADAQALARWLVQARLNARVVATEAHLRRQPAATPTAAALWSGTLVLALPGQ